MQIVLVLAACGPAEPLATTTDAPLVTSTPTAMPTPSAEPLPSVRFVVETPRPPQVDLAHEVNLILAERIGGTTCFFGGDGHPFLDRAELAADVAALPGGIGWVEEPWVWAGGRDELIDALAIEVLAEGEREFWVITEINAFPAGRQYIESPAVLDTPIWVAANTTGPLPPERCPDDEPPASVEPEPTVNPKVVDLGLTMQQLADRWNAQYPPEELILREVSVLIMDAGPGRLQDQSFSVQFPMGHLYGIAWADGRVYAVDVSGERYHDADDAANQQLTLTAMETLIRAVRGDAGEAATDELIAELGIAVVGQPLASDECVERADTRVELDGIRYHFVGEGCPGWSLLIDDVDNPYE